MKIRGLLGGLTVACLLAGAPAHAANDAMLELLKALKANGTIDEQTFEAIKLAAQADDEQNTGSVKEVQAAAKTLPKVETRGKLEIGTPDGAFAWRLGGRVHLDSAWYGNDTGTFRRSALADGTEFRRARMDVTTTLWRVWQLKLQYDFTNSGSAGIRDAFIRYNGNAGAYPWYAMVGNFKEPFSLDEYTSSNDISFIERALPNVFAPSRKIGIGAGTTGQNLWALQGGVFGEGVAPENNHPGCTAQVDAATGAITPCTGDDGEGYAVAGRLVVSPYHSEASDRVLHLAVGTEYRTPDEGETVRFRARPESNLADRLIDTRNLAAVNSTTKVGVEAAGSYGPLSMQGEYLWTSLDRESGLAEPGFNGWYVMGSWLATGESRIYKFPDGVFANPKPRSLVGQGGIGAWEFLVRYSGLDLNDRDRGVVFEGGQQQDLTLGVNWYPIPNLKFMANYTLVLDIEDDDAGSFDDVEPEIFALRAQAYW